MLIIFEHSYKILYLNMINGDVILIPLVTRSDELNHLLNPLHNACVDPEKGIGVPDSSEKSQSYIGFISNIGPVSIKITKLPSQHSMLGSHLNGVSLANQRWPAYCGIWILSPLNPPPPPPPKKNTLSKLNIL